MGTPVRPGPCDRLPLVGGLGKPETLAILGFGFACGGPLNGRFLRVTRRDRMVEERKAVEEGSRRRRHQPIPVQGAWRARAASGSFRR